MLLNVKDLTIITADEKYTIIIFKTRNNNDKNNKGKSSGYRIVSVKLTKHKIGIVFHIFEKSYKRDLTQKEKNNCKEIIKRMKKI